VQILFHELLKNSQVLDRIKRECGGFNLDEEFTKIVGIPLRHWLYLLIAFYSYLSHYIDQDGARHPECMVIDRVNFKGQSRLDQKEIDTVMGLISSTPQDLNRALRSERKTDWRLDFVPLKSKPLIELWPGKFLCSDLGFLVDKMHSGVYWAINDGLSSSDRPKLFKAWGILFEEYVNLFLSDRRFGQPLKFWPRPKWHDGVEESFDSALLQDSRFMPIECKGGLLKLEARYSGKKDVFEMDLDLKIGEGCRQLARKIEAIFGTVPSTRKALQNIPTDHVTRIVPVLVVQDPILRGPFINWHLNRAFERALDKSKLRVGVAVEPLTLVSVNELESMAESAEAGNFDIIHGLQLRCHDDPEMRGGLHNFLLNIAGYGEGRSARKEKSMAEQLAEILKFISED
jgi:hypothetical protein